MKRFEATIVEVEREAPAAGTANNFELTTFKHGFQSECAVR